MRLKETLEKQQNKVSTMKSDVIHFSQNWMNGERNLVSFLEKQHIKTFISKKEALEHGKTFGWKTAVRIVKRFEIVWFVGVKNFQPTEIDGTSYESVTCPLSLDNNSNTITCEFLKKGI